MHTYTRSLCPMLKTGVVSTRVMGFGAWLRSAREERGLSLRQLAERAHNVCTFGYIAQLERETLGKKGQTYQPDLEIVDALAVALEKPMDEARLAAGYAPLSPAEPQPPQNLEELMAALESLGVTHLEWADPEKIKHAPPEAFADVLRAIRLAIRIALEQQEQQNKQDDDDVTNTTTTTTKEIIDYSSHAS